MTTQAQQNHYSQETDLALLEMLLPHVDRTFIDVGAEKGSFAQWLMDRGLKGVCFEPLAKHVAVLRQLAVDTGCLFFEYAVDEMDREADFHVALDDDGKELDYFHSLQALNNDARIKKTRVERVTCRSLESLRRDGKIAPSVGVIKVDTEGNDWRVLKGMGEVRADVLMCEFFTRGLFAGWAEGDPLALIKLAGELGYRRCVAVRRFGSGELVSCEPRLFTDKEWGNLIFMNESVFAAAEEKLRHRAAESELALFAKLAALQQACDERLALIQRLHAEGQALLAQLHEKDRVIQQLAQPTELKAETTHG